MNMRPRLTTIAIGSLLLLAVKASVGTPIAKSDVNIDWSSLTVTPISAGSDPAPVLTWTNLSSTVNGYTSNAVSVGDWATPLTTQVNGLASFSVSDLNATTLHSYSEDNDTGNSGAGIWTVRQGEFSVAGTGSVLFSVNYAWAATLLPPGNSPPISFAYALASLGAETRYDPRGSTNRSAYDQIDVQLASSFPSDIGSFQGHGTLEVNLPVIDGDYFYFTGQSSTTANISAVPMPPTAWLFACGLLGILGVARLRPL